ncbi:MAG TPA: THUMP domain-containing protein, partial [Acidimicrobiia bacterium]|nr:THUMP domain-containing protein [Acidimicrobiia bacterium]
MTPDMLLVHYHEIGLKGRNRPVFERALKQNLKRALRGLASSVRVVPGRVEIADPAPGAIERVQRVFGVANVAPVLLTDAELDSIVRRGLEVAKAADAEQGFETFAVRARRARTGLEVSSQRINEVLGDEIRTGLGKRVDLSAPDVTVRVEVLENRAYVSAHKLPGPGG